MMDVTWLPTRVKGRFFYLYMVEDLFSRYGVHWEVFECESSENTKLIIEQAMWREQNLHLVAFSIDKNIEITIERVIIKMGFHQRAETIVAFTHVGRSSA